jgi:hypothetical protein
MALPRLCAFLLALVFAVSLLQAAPPNTQEIAFAVPGQGLITMGVFNKAGKLVRILHAMDDEEAFRIGLNGYITQWDGRDDAGQKVPIVWHRRNGKPSVVIIETARLAEFIAETHNILENKGKTHTLCEKHG